MNKRELLIAKIHAMHELHRDPIINEILDYLCGDESKLDTYKSHYQQKTELINQKLIEFDACETEQQRDIVNMSIVKIF